MKLYIIKNKKDGRYVSGTDYRYYPHRSIFADSYRAPLVYTSQERAEIDMVHRGISSKRYKIVEVELTEVKNECYIKLDDNFIKKLREHQMNRRRFR